MGLYDGAEACKLVGIHLLLQLKQQLPNQNIRLYRDDDLAIINGSPRNTKNLNKQICKISNNNKLQITIEAKSKLYQLLRRHPEPKCQNLQTIHKTG